MKLLQVVPRSKAKKRLKAALNEKEREIRGKGTTFVRVRAGRWKHKNYWGWINWEETKGGILVAEIQSKVEETEWQLLQAFIGYLRRSSVTSTAISRI
ncbi:MAG: hypothetical protein ABSF48_21750 [Thermodesulfobacteriota bacterium]|jgi:hypothetical protein